MEVAGLSTVPTPKQQGASSSLSSMGRWRSVAAGKAAMVRAKATARAAVAQPSPPGCGKASGLVCAAFRPIGRTARRATPASARGPRRRSPVYLRARAAAVGGLPAARGTGGSAQGHSARVPVGAGALWELMVRARSWGDGAFDRWGEQRGRGTTGGRRGQKEGWGRASPGRHRRGKLRPPTWAGPARACATSERGVRGRAFTARGATGRGRAATPGQSLAQWWTARATSWSNHGGCASLAWGTKDATWGGDRIDERARDDDDSDHCAPTVV